MLFQSQVMEEIPKAFPMWPEFKDTLSGVAGAFGSFHRLDRFRDVCIQKNPSVPGQVAGEGALSTIVCDKSASLPIFLDDPVSPPSSARNFDQPWHHYSKSFALSLWNTGGSTCMNVFSGYCLAKLRFST